MVSFLSFFSFVPVFELFPPSNWVLVAQNDPPTTQPYAFFTLKSTSTIKKPTIQFIILTEKFKKLMVILTPEPQSMHFLRSGRKSPKNTPNDRPKPQATQNQPNPAQTNKRQPTTNRSPKPPKRHGGGICVSNWIN